MNIGNQFSVMDFLAYLFPGIFGTLGLFILLLLTPMKDTLLSIPLDFTTGLIFITSGYALGVFLSGFSASILRFIERVTKYQSSWVSVLVSEFNVAEFANAFKGVFGSSSTTQFEWNKSHFYLCRAMVYEYMPNMAQYTQRQNALVVMRRNLMAPIGIWLFTGIGWGVWTIGNGRTDWGITLISLSILVTISVAVSTVSRMHDSSARVSRYVISAFVAGYKAGAFDKRHSYS